ncbi:MAG: alanine--tRNA ligase-related protein [Clostridia bacterium]|nr:alanine--tRNA ligase-related protein [Clostridia bacterium]
MNLEMLYYKDAYMKEFTSKVVSCTEDKKGYAVVLENTAFYPEGGGQPSDMGMLDDIKVTYVAEKGDKVIHYTDKPIEEGKEVKGVIDWERRFDLMQQHSAEHIVSGMFHEKYGYNNVGFHMGSDMITLDLDGELTWEQVQEIELKANKYVWENRECRIFTAEGEELKNMEYRSKKELEGKVRLVEFPGADLCACCGTHVRYSGELGIIKMFSCQAYKGGVRIEMLCGKRAFDHITAVMEQNKEISNLLSAKIKETSKAVERLLNENYTLKSTVMEMQNEKFEKIVKEYSGKENVLLCEKGLDPNGVRNLANMLMENGCIGKIAVFSGNDEEGYKYAVCEKDGDIRQFIKSMNTTLNGRGGGKPFFAQGSVNGKWTEIEKFFNGQV